MAVTTCNCHFLRKRMEKKGVLEDMRGILKKIQMMVLSKKTSIFWIEKGKKRSHFLRITLRKTEQMS